GEKVPSSAGKASGRTSRKAPRASSASSRRTWSDIRLRRRCCEAVLALFLRATEEVLGLGHRGLQRGALDQPRGRERIDGGGRCGGRDEALLDEHANDLGGG